MTKTNGIRASSTLLTFLPDEVSLLREMAILWLDHTPAPAVLLKRDALVSVLRKLNVNGPRKLKYL